MESAPDCQSLLATNNPPRISSAKHIMKTNFNLIKICGGYINYTKNFRSSDLI